MDMNAFSLKGKIAWITGASYGIGFAIAEAFSAAGAQIIFNDINQELVDKGLKAYAEKGIEAKGYVCDVTNEEAVQALVKQIESEIGVIDVDAPGADLNILVGVQRGEDLYHHAGEQKALALDMMQVVEIHAVLAALYIGHKGNRNKQPGSRKQKHSSILIYHTR